MIDWEISISVYFSAVLAFFWGYEYGRYCERRAFAKDLALIAERINRKRRETNKEA